MSERQMTIDDALFTGEVHPIADLFPMMTDEELDDLAADIKANGLLHPIVIDAEGRLIDGRNRLAGCQRACVQPTFAALNGHDPVEYIFSENDERRHLTKSQRAIVRAEANRLLSRQGMRAVAKRTGVSKAFIGFANIVCEFAPDLVPSVKSGAISLNDAYETARERKQAMESDEAKFARLQASHPDLAVMVQEEKLTLNGALAEAKERDEEAARKELQRKQYIDLRTQRFDAALGSLDPNAMDPDTWAKSYLELNPDVIGATADFSSARARRAAAILLKYADLKETQENGQG